MKKKVITVPLWYSSVMREALAVLQESGKKIPNHYLIKRISEPFINTKGQRMVKVTLVERKREQ